MYTGKIIFAQIMDFLPQYKFRKCVKRYQGNYKVQKFSCLDQFLCMAFAQLTFRESLRDIESCLRAIHNKLYHIGIRGKISKSTLADANENRDWHIYADFAQILISKARKLYSNDSFGLDLNETVYALDSSTIDLCLSLFPWAHFRRRKGAIKLHTLLDLRGPIPAFIRVTDGSVHDVNILDDLVIEPGAFYIFDRGYLDFERLFRFKEQAGFFITRTKKNFQYQRIYSHPVDKSLGFICDQTIRLTGFYSQQHYPEKLRRIRYFDSETQKHFTFLTNHFGLPAITIAQLYKCRWQVELFFKWIKQHLRIKAFYGTSENAVKTQVWIAISIYVLIAIIKKQLKIEQSLYTILQVLSIIIFEKTPILQALAQLDHKEEMGDSHKQLLLFDL
ncbi:MAG: IS4 family transposase [Candidatus Omnitrophota bacterium]|nr:IS4 family transposase [Candidatus Omnitrophota bacterium]